MAYSQVKESHNVGSCWIVPQEMYSPLEQQAVLLQRARDNPAARDLLSFLKTRGVQKIIEGHGYQLPQIAARN